MRTSKAILLISISIFLRTCISLHSHSGQDNYHGSKTAYGGDFEAQRHWMELTIHLPLSEWYTYDPTYWGLDYPPLTAYGSYILGLCSQFLVGEESVALFQSRGYEDRDHKAFMRGTVIVLDFLIYFPAVWILSKRIAKSSASLILTALSQPALLLIDHGHFQYNSVCLGLSLLSFHFITLDENAIGINAIIGSVLFCLALGWKQMGLYYAPAVFSYLLGRCLSSTAKKSCLGFFDTERWFLFLTRIGVLGITVISTFGVLIAPFIIYRDLSSQTITEVILIILRRIFPIQRGLFEGKVSNLWCMLSLKPISIRERIAQDTQPIFALCLTFAIMLPFCIMLFCIGKGESRKGEKQQQKHLKAILWGTAGTSLSFFLASFQVHEKSILLPLSPLSLLMMEAPTLVFWFSMVTAWTLWHLLQSDRLRLAYFCTCHIFYCYVKWFIFNGSNKDGKKKYFKRYYSKLDRWAGTIFVKYIVPASSAVMIVLHLVEIFKSPPETMPDMYPVLWVIFGCLYFLLTWIGIIYFLWMLLLLPDDKKEKEKNQ